MKKNKLLLIGPIPEPTTGVSLANKIIVENIKSFSVETINTSFNEFKENLGAFSFKKLFFYLKMNLSLYKVLRANIIYITPGQTFFGVVKYGLFIVLSGLLKKELIIHVHGNYIRKQYTLLTGLKKRIFVWLLKKTSKGIVLSESLRDNMRPFIKEEKIFECYNFVEDYLLNNKPQIIEKTKHTKPRIVFLSNLMEEKGIFDLLEALFFLESNNISYEAKIAGSIDQANKFRCEKYFNKLKNTKYCGVVRGEDKRELLLWSNTFILPTYYSMEGQPISILEAMATGNVILVTKHSGIPDIFEEEKNGYYLEKQNPEDIATKIIMLSRKEELQNIRNRNHNEALEKYKVKTFIQNIEQIFKHEG